MPEWNRLSGVKIEDITSNSTRWEIASAAPSEETLKIQFTALATINFVVATSCFILLVSILRVKVSSFAYVYLSIMTSTNNNHMNI